MESLGRFPKGWIMLLRFEGVGREYALPGGKTLTALHAVDLAVDRGETVALTGRSGSGKSTLLHLAAGIDRPTTGRVLLRDRPLSTLPDRERTRERRNTVGLLYQFFHLLPHLSVLENVLLPAWIAGDPAAPSERRAGDLIERVGLGGREKQAVEQLSGGEMQRVALCRALMRKPALLLADEPTGNLDDETGRAVMDLLFELVDEERAALLYVTHSDEVAARAGRRLRIHSGRIDAP